MNSKQAANTIKFLAYRDGEYDVRTYIENRISRSAADAAYRLGMTLRERDINNGSFPNISNQYDLEKAKESIQ